MIRRNSLALVLLALASVGAAADVLIEGTKRINRIVYVANVAEHPDLAFFTFVTHLNYAAPIFPAKPLDIGNGNPMNGIYVVGIPRDRLQAVGGKPQPGWFPKYFHRGRPYRFPLPKCDGPGMHLLIAGVSSYRHGKGGQGKPATIDLGIGQLTAAATTAYLLCDWFLAHVGQFEIPLASVRALLSPAAEEIERRPVLSDFGDRCTLDNFLTAAAEWREDAARHPESLTVFYFAGHGAQRTKGDSILLFEDFGDGVGGPLRRAVDTETIFYGMAPSTKRRQIARRQLYFIDACRVRPAVFKNYRLMHTSPVFEVDEVERDDRSAPIFFAATSGSQAYSVPGEQTTFGRILLDVLSGGDPGATSMVGKSRSVISVHSLDEELQAGIEESNRKTGADQEYSLEGIAKDAILLSWGK